MATGGKKETSSNLLNIGTLTLKSDDLHPWGVSLVRDKLVITDMKSKKVHIYRRHDGILLSSTDKLESSPESVCCVSDTDLCVAIYDGSIAIMSVQDSGLIYRRKTFHLRPSFNYCHGVALWNDNIVVSGVKDNTIYWCFVPVQDGRPNNLLKVCTGFISYLTVKQDMVYIACNSLSPDDRGVYGFNLLDPSQPTYRYKHKELWLYGITVNDSGYLFLRHWNSIYHLTGKCELVTIYKDDIPRLPSAICWDSGILYLASSDSNVITMYETPQQPSDVMQAPSAPGSKPSTIADVMQAPSLDDTGRFVHIACLLVNVGSRVLRRLLLYHTVTPTCTLDQYLAKKRIDIDNLRKRKILNKSQMGILFPPGGSTNLGDYNITLLSALFTNIVLTISQQQLNMIQFLRDKRNEIFAHAKSVTVNLNDYQTFWNDICRVLEALSKQCNDPDFENEISKEIQGIQVSTVQGSSLLDTLQTHYRRMETLERLVQDLMSSHAQESNKESDDSDS